MGKYVYDDDYTEYQNIILERFLHLADNQDKKIGLIMLSCLPKQEGYEEEMLKYIKSYPNATYDDAMNYMHSIVPPVEVSYSTD